MNPRLALHALVLLTGSTVCACTGYGDPGPQVEIRSLTNEEHPHEGLLIPAQERLHRSVGSLSLIDDRSFVDTPMGVKTPLQGHFQSGTHMHSTPDNGLHIRCGRRHSKATTASFE